MADSFISKIFLFVGGGEQQEEKMAWRLHIGLRGFRHVRLVTFHCPFLFFLEWVFVPPAFLLIFGILLKLDFISVSIQHNFKIVNFEIS